MKLADVERFFVPRHIVAETEVTLQSAGNEGYEAFVLWTGRQEGASFQIINARVPRQTSYRLVSGVCVRVDGEELHKLNIWLFEAAQTLAVQVHAHPTDAYHSDTDDAYPIVATLGGLSIVVPDFCRRGLLVHDTAMYRLRGTQWIRESNDCVEVV